MPQELFILREEHAAAFYRAGVKRSERRARLLLRKRYPVDLQSVSDPDFILWIESWTAKVRPLGLLTDRQMFLYYEASILLLRKHVRINDDKRVHDLLRSKLDSDTKASSIREYAMVFAGERTLKLS